MGLTLKKEKNCQKTAKTAKKKNVIIVKKIVVNGYFTISVNTTLSQISVQVSSGY